MICRVDDGYDIGGNSTNVIQQNRVTTAGGETLKMPQLRELIIFEEVEIYYLC